MCRKRVTPNPGSSILSPRPPVGPKKTIKDRSSTRFSLAYNERPHVKICQNTADRSRRCQVCPAQRPKTTIRKWSPSHGLLGSLLQRGGIATVIKSRRQIRSLHACSGTSSRENGRGWQDAKTQGDGTSNNRQHDCWWASGEGPTILLWRGKLKPNKAQWANHESALVAASRGVDRWD